MMRMAWLLGWAVPEPWFGALVREHFPEAEHLVFPATPAGLARLAAEAPCDRMIGYSLGALLLLEQVAAVGRHGPVTLIAPVFAFPREAGLGGRVARAQIRALVRWLRRDRAAALADFHARCGFCLPAGTRPDVTDDELLWGLERLETLQVPPRLPPGWNAWCGDGDPLLDAVVLRALEPAVRIVPGATHHPAALLRAMREDCG